MMSYLKKFKKLKNKKLSSNNLFRKWLNSYLNKSKLLTIIPINLNSYNKH
jgi:hypothetical protein